MDGGKNGYFAFPGGLVREESPGRLSDKMLTDMQIFRVVSMWCEERGRRLSSCQKLRGIVGVIREDRGYLIIRSLGCIDPSSSRLLIPLILVLICD